MVGASLGSSSPRQASRVFVILNPLAGRAIVEEVHRALERYFTPPADTYTVHETCGHENLAELARAGVDQHAELVVAAGGDGTVSGVADGLVGTETPLGIIPLGTTNVLARELGIPVNIDGACALIAGPHATRVIDAMRLGDAYYYTQVGVGIDAMMIRDTKTEAKRKFGKLAYLWSALMHLFGFQPRKFRIDVDGHASNRNASQVLLANSGTLGQAPLRWGPNIRPDDGRIDVCVVRAKNIVDYLILFVRVLLGMHRGSRNVRYLVARRFVAVASKKPLPVQADGEIVGQTPLHVDVVRNAVRVVSPVL